VPATFVDDAILPPEPVLIKLAPRLSRRGSLPTMSSIAARCSQLPAAGPATTFTRHVIGCLATQETRVQHDAAGAVWRAQCGEFRVMVQGLGFRV
jgi:hypothetical protein